jgi:hypothetical protein
MEELTMEMLFMRKDKVIIISRNVFAVPHIGDSVVIDGIKVKVLDVIWHLDHSTWVEIQI